MPLKKVRYLDVELRHFKSQNQNNTHENSLTLPLL